MIKNSVGNMSGTYRLDIKYKYFKFKNLSTYNEINVKNAAIIAYFNCF